MATNSPYQSPTYNLPRGNTHMVNNNSQGAYQDRYKRSASTAMGKMYDTGPYIVGLFSFLVAVSGIVALLAWDILTGNWTGDHFTNGNNFASWMSSLATTGLITALFGTVLYGWRLGWSWKVLIPLTIVALIPAAIDTYFDGMSMDLIRFGHYISITSLAPEEQVPHELFRVMSGAMSAIGEPLSAGAIIVFPILKELFEGIFK